MSGPYAFVTLLTSDAYLPGALAIAAALNDVHQPLPSDQTVEYETVCLVAPETVEVTAIRLLRKAFNVVIGVEIIVPPDTESLNLLGAFFLAFCAPQVPTRIINSIPHVCLLASSPRLDYGSMQRCFLLSYHSLDVLVTSFSI